MSKEADTSRAIVLTGFAITGLLELVVVGTCCFLWIKGAEVPKGLNDLLIGVTVYAFTTIPAQVSKYMEMNKTGV